MSMDRNTWSMFLVTGGITLCNQQEMCRWCHRFRHGSGSHELISMYLYSYSWGNTQFSSSPIKFL